MKVAFLDRDGVINKEVNYLHRIADFEYTNKCVLALKKLVSLNYKIIVITNQAGIARGYYTESQYQELTDWYVNDLKEKGVDILDVFHCPHHPEGVRPELSIKCSCRKPSTGLIKKALEKYSIDLTTSIMVGDKISDMKAGANAGVNRCVLVKSGHRIENKIIQYSIYDDLHSFVQIGL